MNGPTVTEFQNAAQMVVSWKHPLLISHARPDGDALGSLLATQELLRPHGADATILLFDPLPSRYDFLSALGRFSTLKQDISLADLNRHDGVVILDTCAYGQLDPVSEWLQTSSLPKLAVDHHVTRDDVADTYLINESAAACAGIVFDWAKANDWPISPNATSAMFVGIATDTGWFRHANTNGSTLQTCAELIELGAKPNALFQELFQRDPISRVRLLGEALQGLEFFDDDRIAVMSLSRENFERATATRENTEGIINEPLGIDSVIVALMLVEAEDNLVRVSLRSKAPTVSRATDVDVAAIAASLGGGGHRRAAGVRLTMSLTAARDTVLAAVRSSWPT